MPNSLFDTDIETNFELLIEDTDKPSLFQNIPKTNEPSTKELSIPKVYKIGICGAHGTGKTTLAKAVHELFGTPIITNLMRSFWAANGVADFEKLPKDIRTIFQKESLLKQIESEESYTTGFITDRTVLDQIAYTKLSSNMIGVEFEIYEQLCKERLKTYTHLLYLPIEFESEQEFLRADISTRVECADIMKSYLDKWMPDQYIIVSGEFEERVKQVKTLLS
jgi:adenylate kinase family enzyme